MKEKDTCDDRAKALAQEELVDFQSPLNDGPAEVERKPSQFVMELWEEAKRKGWPVNLLDLRQLNPIPSLGFVEQVEGVGSYKTGDAKAMLQLLEAGQKVEGINSQSRKLTRSAVKIRELIMNDASSCRFWDLLSTWGTISDFRVDRGMSGHR